MAEQTPKKKKSCSGWLLGCGFGLLLFVALILFAGAIGYVLTRNTLARTPLMTTISMPQNQEQAEVNLQLPIQASASYSEGVARVEVYADGALVLTQDAAEEGATSLSAAGTWTPLTAGSHILTARGYGSDETFADSSIVNVIVTEPPENVIIDVDKIKKEPEAPNPSLADIASAYGMTPGELARRNPGLSGTSHTDPLPSGTLIDAPRPPVTSSPPSPASPPGPSSPPSPPSGAPAAPTNLTSIVTCTNATLTWTDSPDETSYRVYRLDLGATNFRVVADSLPANTPNYNDTLPAPGVYSYRVAAVHAGSEGLSLLARAETPGACPEPAAPFGGVSDLMLTIATVDTTSPYEGVYCYLSINGQPYERIPLGTGLLPPESGNNLYYNLTRLPGGARYSLSGQSFDAPVTLQGECDGLQAPFSHGLGTFSISHPQADWDGRMLRADGGLFHFSYCIGPASVPCTPNIPGGTSGYTAVDSPFSEIITFNLPPPNSLALAFSTPADCAALTDNAERLACGLGESFNPSTCRGRWHILNWNWVETPSVPESALTSYVVMRTVHDRAGNQLSVFFDVTRQADGSLPRRFLSDIRDVGPGERVEYQVRANRGGLYSDWSDPVSFTSPICMSFSSANPIIITVTFIDLQAGPVNDTGEVCLFGFPCLSDHTLEMKGYLWTLPGTAALIAHPTGPDPAPAIPINEGSNPMAGMPFIGGNVFEGQITNDQQTVTFGAWLRDINTDEVRNPIGQDILCDDQMVIPAQSMTLWSTLNQNYTIHCRGTESNISLIVNVKGSPAR